MEKITQIELKKLTISRLLKNDNESVALYEVYKENVIQNEYKGDFGTFLNEFYKDLGTKFDSCFEEVEEIIIENLESNNDYMD